MVSCIVLPILKDRGAKSLLLLFLLIAALLLLLGGLGLLSAHTAGTPAAKRRGEGEVDVLLGVETDDERRDVDDLLADAA